MYRFKLNIERFHRYKYFRFRRQRKYPGLCAIEQHGRHMLGPVHHVSVFLFVNVALQVLLWLGEIHFQNEYAYLKSMYKYAHSPK